METSVRIKAFRFVAYSAVTFSVVSVISICITLPMVYNFIANVKGKMYSDIKDCKVTVRDIWTDVQGLRNVETMRNRTTREAYSYREGPPSMQHSTGVSSGVNSAFNIGFGSSSGLSGGAGCNCRCTPGQPGRTGVAGKPGRPGRPGSPGQPGLP
ncbi:unnamed protein product, partial [Enterobius vermicularis]|uniref:Col_cuticle_N domain-containing protein n=1 Tax=Enterobius vermicularis TaxID=51028 RepID=A0A0N4VDV6_ENTVE